MLVWILKFYCRVLEVLFVGFFCHSYISIFISENIKFTCIFDNCRYACIYMYVCGCVFLVSEQNIMATSGSPQNTKVEWCWLKRNCHIFISHLRKKASSAAPCHCSLGRTLTALGIADTVVRKWYYLDVISWSLFRPDQLWDVRRKGCIFTYKGHTNVISCLQFSPDGKWIVSTSEDGTVKVSHMNTLYTCTMYLYTWYRNPISSDPMSLCLGVFEPQVSSHWWCCS